MADQTGPQDHVATQRDLAQLRQAYDDLAGSMRETLAMASTLLMERDAMRQALMREQATAQHYAGLARDMQHQLDGFRARAATLEEST